MRTVQACVSAWGAQAALSACGSGRAQRLGSMSSVRRSCVATMQSHVCKHGPCPNTRMEPTAQNTLRTRSPRPTPPQPALTSQPTSPLEHPAHALSFKTHPTPAGLTSFAPHCAHSTLPLREQEYKARFPPPIHAGLSQCPPAAQSKPCRPQRQSSLVSGNDQALLLLPPTDHLPTLSAGQPTFPPVFPPRDGRRRQQIELLLPLIGATDLDDVSLPPCPRPWASSCASPEGHTVLWTCCLSLSASAAALAGWCRATS